GIRRAPEQTREHILVELDYRGDNFVPLNRVRVSWSRRRVGAPRADAATGPKPPIEMTPKGSGANSHASREGREGLRNNQQKCLIRRVTNKFVASSVEVPRPGRHCPIEPRPSAGRLVRGAAFRKVDPRSENLEERQLCRFLTISLYRINTFHTPPAGRATRHLAKEPA